MSTRPRSIKHAALLLAWFCAAQSHAATNVSPSDPQRAAIDAIVRPLQQQYTLPGVAVAVTVDGKPSFYNYGVMSKATGEPITSHTLFEIGSLSKTFTATLACHAQIEGKLSLQDDASRYIPELRGSSFDHVSLLNLATHTSGLPLFEPDDVKTEDQLMAYYKAWKPTHPVGTYRVYSNLGIGLLGIVTARSLHTPFKVAIEKTLLPELGMTNSYIDVPADAMKRYAQGYTKTDAPVRVAPGVLETEAYGLKSSTSDLIRFVGANMQLVPVNDTLRRAIDCTHTGYYTASGFVQDPIWEQYAYPTSLDTVVAGNGPDVVMKGSEAAALTPPLPSQSAVLLNKTGSTNGFSAYVAFIPAKKLGVVILANKATPLDARVSAAYRILEALGTQSR